MLHDSSDTSGDAVAITSNQVGQPSDTFFGAGGFVVYTSLSSLELEMGSGPNRSMCEALRWTLAAGQRGPSIVFNIGFDAPRLAAHGVPFPEPWWDVMLAAATCQPDLKKSLNFVASLYLDLKRWKNLSDEDPALYNALVRFIIMMRSGC